MNILTKLTNFVQRVFKTNLEIFLEALRLSPNAQGYVSGSISELLLKKELENNYALIVKRIREKWEGKKHPNHHGDFYFKSGDNWFVLESKGVKSNSEKWHKLYNFNNLKNFLYNHNEKINWIDPKTEVEPQIINWITTNLPLMLTTYSNDLYDFEEITKYVTPKKETAKSQAIDRLRQFTREEIQQQIQERLEYVMAKVKVLETHFVSGASANSARTQATPRKDEFNVISIDIFLRHTEHKFLFANPQMLDSSGDDANHLQQNYIMGFIFTDNAGNLILNTTQDWFEDLNEVIQTLDPNDAINENEMQVDFRLDEEEN